MSEHGCRSRSGQEVVERQGEASPRTEARKEREVSFPDCGIGDNLAWDVRHMEPPDVSDVFFGGVAVLFKKFEKAFKKKEG